MYQYMKKNEQLAYLRLQMYLLNTRRINNTLIFLGNKKIIINANKSDFFKEIKCNSII